MKMHTFLLSAISAVSLAGASQATTVDLDPIGSDAFGTPAWYETVTRTIGTSTKHLYAGMFRLVDTSSLEEFLAFCIEPGVWLDLSKDFETGVTSSPWDTALTDIDKLYSYAYADVVDASSAAAFQVALWEIVSETDTNYDIADGTTTFTGMSSDASTKAQGFLAGLMTAETGVYELTTFVNSGQDLVSGTPVAPVPLPASALLLLGGMGAVAALRRKKA